MKEAGCIYLGAFGEGVYYGFDTREGNSRTDCVQSKNSHVNNVYTLPAGVIAQSPMLDSPIELLMRLRTC